MARRPPRDRRRRLLLLALASPLLVLASLQACAALLRNANALGRRCASLDPPPPLRVAIVSFSEERAGARRSFRGVAEAAGGNKRAYAARWGYDFIDARALVDPARPPNWSKIVAVRSHLPAYDWVFWNDADTVVANPEVSLENILAAALRDSKFHVTPDLVVTEDINGINSGVFFLRRSKWSQAFLDDWWNQTSFIRFGSTKSGDNAAMKHLIDSLPPEELKEHVHVSPMQCIFNSYPWSPSWKSVFRLISSPYTIWKGAYSNGDFMIHLAGLDDKKQWIAKVLHEIELVD